MSICPGVSPAHARGRIATSTSSGRDPGAPERRRPPTRQRRAANPSCRADSEERCRSAPPRPRSPTTAPARASRDRTLATPCAVHDQPDLRQFVGPGLSHLRGPLPPALRKAARVGVILGLEDVRRQHPRCLARCCRANLKLFGEVPSAASASANSCSSRPLPHGLKKALDTAHPQQCS